MLYNILAIGDVVGGCGVSCLEHHLRAVKKLKNIHFTVVNGENAAMVGLILASAFLPSNPAPIVIRASGVAICATLLIVLSMMTGKSSRSSAAISPVKMPSMIGFFAMLIHASFTFSLPLMVSSVCASNSRVAGIR